MTFEFLPGTAATENPDLLEFYNSVAHSAGEQHPYWPENKFLYNSCRFIAYDEKKRIVCTAQIFESKKIGIKLAEIRFGPLFNDADALVESLERIYEYYKKKDFAKLTVQLGFPTGPLADLIEYKVAQKLPVKYVFDRENWSSIAVDLTQTEEELYKKLSKGHKRHLKKAANSNITVTYNYTPEEFEEFATVYMTMTTQRGLSFEDSQTRQLFRSLKAYFDEFNAGRFVLVKSGDGKVIGGLILVFQGKVVRYYRGASDPSARDLPVMHLGFWESFKTLREQGFETFDLWGYNHFVDESDQIFFVNQFKRGFGGDFVFYPKKMYFVYKPLHERMFNLARRTYKWVTRKKINPIYDRKTTANAQKGANEKIQERSEDNK